MSELLHLRDQLDDVIARYSRLESVASVRGIPTITGFDFDDEFGQIEQALYRLEALYTERLSDLEQRIVAGENEF